MILVDAWQRFKRSKDVNINSIPQVRIRVGKRAHRTPMAAKVPLATLRRSVPRSDKLSKFCHEVSKRPEAGTFSVWTGNAV
jgi:hypothetical protein